MFGIIRRLLQWKSGKSRYFAGYDLEGNRFYEYPASTNNPDRTKRVVEYRIRRHMSEYTSGSTHLPVQWQAWLSRIRASAPSLEELQSDVQRRKQLLTNVAAIEERDRERRTHEPLPAPRPMTERIPEPTASPDPSAAQAPPRTAQEQRELNEKELRRKRREMYKTPLSAFKPVEPATDVPETWNAQPRRRVTR